MDEYLQPVVALKKLNFDDTLESFNCCSDNQILYVNITDKRGSGVPENTEDPLTEKNIGFEKRTKVDKILKGKKHVDSPRSKNRVSFSNRSSILYYFEDQVIGDLPQLRVEYTNSLTDSSGKNDKLTHTPGFPGPKPDVEPFNCLSTNGEVRYPELALENEQSLQLKNLIIPLEKLPMNLLKEVKNENYVPVKHFQSSTPLFESHKDYEQSSSQSVEDRKITESSENILSDNDDDNDELKCDIQPTKTFFTDPLSEGNIHLLPELKVSLQRLPDNLLKLHFNNSVESLNFSNQVVSDDQQESIGLSAPAVKTVRQNSVKELKLNDHHGTISEKDKSVNHNCNIFIKNPVVQLERLNLMFHEIEDSQPVKRKQVEENMLYHEQDDNSMQTKYEITLPVNNSSSTPTIVPKTSKGRKRPETFPSNGCLNYNEKHKSSLSHQSKTCNKKEKLKSHLQNRNKASVAKGSDNFLLTEQTEVICVQHNALPPLQLVENSSMDSSCFTSGEPLRHNSHQHENSESSLEDEKLPSSNWYERDSNLAKLSSVSNKDISKPCTFTGDPICISDNNSSEDDMPLSLLSHLHVKKPEVSTSLKKNIKERSHKNSTSAVHKHKFTDFNVLCMSEIIPPDSLTFMSDVKKKSQKTALSKTKKTHSKQKIILLSPLKNAALLDPLALRAEVKKKTSKMSSSPKKSKNSGGRKCMPSEEIILLPHATKISCINPSTLVSNKQVQSNCKNTSTSNLKHIASDHCYDESMGSKAGCNRILSPLKKVKLDHNYDLSCNVYTVKRNQFICKSDMNVSKRTASMITKAKTLKRKKKTNGCQKGKKKKTLDPDVFLKTYLQKFCSDFDKVRNGKSSSSPSGSQQKKQLSKQARKRKENAYKFIISEMHEHLKNTCSVKKSFKERRAKSSENKENPIQYPVIKVETEEGFAMEAQPAQPEGNFASGSKIRNKSKVSEVDKYRLGLLTGNRSLRLYNRCLAAERMLLSKYKMNKRQKKKLKKLFNSLKNNLLHTKML